MNEQLRWITHFLDAHSIPYWVDYGTLLGLMREGDLLKKGRKAPDNDIDISMWSRYEPYLRNVLPLVREAGYVIRRYSYNGFVYKYFLIPKIITTQWSHDLPPAPFIDLSLYRKHGDHAWCPECYPTNPARLGYLRYLHPLLRDSLYKVLWGWSIPQIRFMNTWITVDVSAWPWRAFAYDVGTSWIPRFYFDNITRARGFDVLLPRDWESYLEFRYGDWKTPVEEWRYWIDDGGFQRKPPNEIIAGLEKASNEVTT